MTAPALVGRGEIEELESALQGVVEARFLAGPVCANRALDLATHIPQLLGQSEGLPAPVRESRVHGFHGSVISRVTIPRIASRVSSSSTPRDLFPWPGRRLIMESNSIISSPASWG